MGFWQLGNTSVRSALRIRDGLIALSKSTIQGNIRNVEGDIAFRELLGQSGIVSLGDDKTNSVGRKWRSAMEKLGFIYPKVNKTMGFSQSDLGELDAITPAGRNLIDAQTVASIQECYLRAMVTPTTPTGDGSMFSPLCWVLTLMLNLEQISLDASITFPEMAAIVITSTPSDGINNIIMQITKMREARNSAESKRTFDRNLYDQKANELHCVSSTFSDYADMNIRYLKATGMVQAKGKGITLVPEKHTVAVQLTQIIEYKEPLLSLYRTLCEGSDLPTDHQEMAEQVLRDLLPQAKKYGIHYTLEGKPFDTPARVNQARYEIEQLIAEKKEEYYALHQANEWQEIAAYMDLLAAHKEHLQMDEDTEIRIPKSEAPAYLEWSLWRAFLAIDSLVNKPYNIRRFNIDQDFMPVSTAPGNGPDLIAEFQNFVVVIEVTLSESSRQEAMEGEPVRRHVADLMQQYTKPVYGLFIANRIDSNTAETFRIGCWYTKDDIKLQLRIVPISLQLFSYYFKAMFQYEQSTPIQLTQLFAIGISTRIYEAPKWKMEIDRYIKEHVSAMQQSALDKEK